MKVILIWLTVVVIAAISTSDARRLKLRANQQWHLSRWQARQKIKKMFDNLKNSGGEVGIKSGLMASPNCQSGTVSYCMWIEYGGVYKKFCLTNEETLCTVVN